jgi:transposase
MGCAASDTTDEEWALIAPHLPLPARRGRTRRTSLRDVVNAIHYIAESGSRKVKEDLGSDTV